MFTTRHRRTVLLWSCGLVLALSVAASGQTAGTHRGIFLGLGENTQLQSGIGELNPQGRFTIYPTSSQGPWIYRGNVRGAVQDIDNQSMIVAGCIGNPATSWVYVRWDPTVRSITSVVWRGPTTASRPSSDLTLNSDGNVVGYFQGPVVNQIVELDPRTGVMIANPMPIIPSAWGWLGGVGGVEWDKVQGGYLAANSNAWANPMQQTLLWTRADLRASSVVATAGSGLAAALGGTLLDNGDWVSSSMSANFAYLEVKAGSGRWTTGAFVGGQIFVDVSAEKYAAPGRGYYASMTNFGPSYHVAYVHVTSMVHAVTTLGTTPQANVLGGIMEAHPLYERDLCSVRRGNWIWDVLINPDPTGSLGLRNKPYVLAMSLAGAAPPIALPDGREIFLVPDIFTVLTVQQLLPYLTGNIGKLNAFGAGAARLDLSPLKGAANGLILHFCGVVLDPSAPSGTAWVLDPWALLVK